MRELLLRAKVIVDQRGLSETVQYGGLTILTCVVLVGAAVIISPSLEGGMTTVTSRISSTFTTIAGL